MEGKRLDRGDQWNSQGTERGCDEGDERNSKHGCAESMEFNT